MKSIITDENRLPNIALVEGYSVNECVPNDENTQDCRFLSHIVRSFRTFDASDYQLTDSTNQEYEAIGFYYIYNDEASTDPYQP